jgi:hypothetical protein
MFPEVGDHGKERPSRPPYRVFREPRAG